MELITNTDVHNYSTVFMPFKPKVHFKILKFPWNRKISKNLYLETVGHIFTKYLNENRKMFFCKNQALLTVNPVNSWSRLGGVQLLNKNNHY